MTRLPYRNKHWLSQRLDVDSIALWRRFNPDAHRFSDESRVQRRLEKPTKSDRAFLKLIKRKRAQPSRLNRRLTTQHFRHKLLRGTVLSTFLGLSLGTALWGSLFIRERVTLGGVPYRVVQTFWRDRPARDAYFGGDNQALHDRLQTLEVEESIKEYYLTRFDDGRFDADGELDLFVHQVMFDRTGYIGEAYKVDDYGQLSPVQYEI